MTPLEAALQYEAKGMSVIPVGMNKRPLIKWEPHQTTRATPITIRQWWKDNPKANVGIVTGAISNLLVIDCDTPEAIQQVQGAIPENLAVPCETTPRNGMHFFFSHSEGFVNRARVAEGIDIRTTGGYVAVAPSINSNGSKWEWVLSVLEADPPDIALGIKDLFFNSFSFNSLQGTYAGGGAKRQELVTSSHNFFKYGRRDEDLFHLANCLTKGGSEPSFISDVLERIILSWGENPDRKWIEAKVLSALKRADKRERNLTEEVRQWILVTSGHFSVTDSHKELGLVTPSHKHAANVAMRRLVEEGIIEKYGDKRGCYRLIDRSMNIQEWRKAKGKPLNIRFPLEVERFVKLFPGNVILLEGQKSQGKSAFAIEFCRLNHELFPEKILYQNVEMSDDEWLERFSSYAEVKDLQSWEQIMTIIRQTDSWWDKVLSDGLNVIDYLIEYKESYLIADYVFKIHQKLKSGIALILIQRDPFKPYPTGGRGVRDIPRLILSLMHHKIKIEDVKSFKKTDFGNPTGLVRSYKQVSWWRFLEQDDWHREEEEKYADFAKGTLYKNG